MSPWVLRLLVANVAIFMVTAANQQLFQTLMLVPAAVLVRPWTPVTYMFLHAGIGHLFFNMIGLFFFGPRLEDRLGGTDFLKLYFFSGVGAAAFSFIFAPGAAVVGASGAVFGVLLAFAYYWPRENIYIWGVLPIQSRWFAILLVVISLYSGISESGSDIAHFAHLGGLAIGYLYIWLRERRKLKARRVVEKPNSHYKSKGVSDVESKHRWSSIPVDRLHEINREEVESLLEKVTRLGVNSLSPSERAFLDRMAEG